ncbi:zinc finger protein 502-like [Ailuropoda melanoleuca]|uniref:zinc finger protein 502-like n=1 Tax=Ailuropoda melanoleuca TaxID=9646 RepID=UPI001493FB34|nr:zinc finger protein 502-like [Ailuropoda melanoleuca]
MQRLGHHNCGKAFTLITNLLDHQRIHTGEKPFACDVCSSLLRRQAPPVPGVREGLPQEVRPGQPPPHTHRGKRPFKCYECGKAFAQSALLVGHQKTHTGEKAYPCRQCGKCFTKSSAHILQERIHSGGRPLQCGVCGKAFVRKSTLFQHGRIHAGEKPCQCAQCGKAFRHQPTLTAHAESTPGRSPTSGLGDISFRCREGKCGDGAFQPCRDKQTSGRISQFLGAPLANALSQAPRCPCPCGHLKGVWMTTEGTEGPPGHHGSDSTSQRKCHVQ